MMFRLYNFNDYISLNCACLKGIKRSLSAAIIKADAQVCCI